MCTGFVKGDNMKIKTVEQIERQIRIEKAAYEILAEKGYKAASMLSIAKRASASNETLYRWYKNKQSLFCSLVKENARETKELLEHSIAADTDPLETLQKIGPVLLKLVTGKKAIALNRAAAGDVFDTGTLGKVIASAGKETVAPLIVKVLERARRKGQMDFENAHDAADIYTGLLIGDLQIRRVIGVCKQLTQKEIDARSQRAVSLLLRLFGPHGGASTIFMNNKH
jgi:AcrR family transcriptional regulator